MMFPTPSETSIPNSPSTVSSLKPLRRFFREKESSGHWNMGWICASCGRTTKTNRQKCRRCGSSVWKPILAKDPSEVSGQLKRISPKGLLLANPGRQTPIQDSNNIECGNCHAVIYRADIKFDTTVLQEAITAHQLTSPGCRNGVSKQSKPAS